MNAFKIEYFIYLRKQIRFVFHILGRIRVEVILSALKQLSGVDTRILESLQAEARHIRRIHVQSAPFDKT